MYNALPYKEERNVPRNAILEIHKDELQFSAGHFTIFSATERENIHGHNFNVNVEFHFVLAPNGISFDYRFYRSKLSKLCEQLHLRFLAPEHSPFLKIEDAGDCWFLHFNNEKIPFLKRDLMILPVANVTIEELSYWFLQQLLQQPNELDNHGIHKLIVRVFNAPGQSGAAEWSKQNRN